MGELEQTIADLIKQNKINQFEDTVKLQDKNKPLIYLPNFFPMILIKEQSCLMWK